MRPLVRKRSSLIMNVMSDTCVCPTVMLMGSDEYIESQDSFSMRLDKNTQDNVFKS